MYHLASFSLYVKTEFSAQLVSFIHADITSLILSWLYFSNNLFSAVSVVYILAFES